MAKRIAVVGGGIIGLALAYKLQLKHREHKVVLFEKELKLGIHQSGRNSGVLHCGLYYQPGSLKAKLAVSGIQQMTDFCRHNEVSHDICGKIVVATEEKEIRVLEEYAKRGEQNGLKGLKYLSESELRKREPAVKAKRALLVPEEGIVDYDSVMNCLAKLLKDYGGEVVLGKKIVSAIDIHDSVVLSDGSDEFIFNLVYNCSGLFSDRTYAAFTGKKRPLRIVPFRGEYLKLKPEVNEMVNHLIYPVPDISYPFLGVHFTRLINGEREVGPNAVFAFKREGYTNRDFSLTDTYDSLSYHGFIKFVVANWKFSLGELKSSLFISSFIKKAQKLIPDVDESMLVKGNAGVRAQAIDSAGKLLMDFNIIRIQNQIHVLNAPSPGATSSLAIAEHIVNNY